MLVLFAVYTLTLASMSKCICTRVTNHPFLVLLGPLISLLISLM